MMSSKVPQYVYIDPRNASSLKDRYVDEVIARADGLMRYFPTLTDEGVAELINVFGESVLFGEEEEKKEEVGSVSTYYYFNSIPFRYIEELGSPHIRFNQPERRESILLTNGEVKCVIQCNQRYFYVEILIDNIDKVGAQLTNIGSYRYSNGEFYSVYNCAGFEAYLGDVRRSVILSQYELDTVLTEAESGTLGYMGNHALFTESPMRLSNKQLRELKNPLTTYEASTMRESAQESWKHPIQHDKLTPSIAYSARTKIVMAFVAIAVVAGWIVFEAFAAYYRWQVSFGMFQHASVWLIGLFGFTSLFVAGLSIYTLNRSWHSQHYYEPKHLLYTEVTDPMLIEGSVDGELNTSGGLLLEMDPI